MVYFNFKTVKQNASTVFFRLNRYRNFIIAHSTGDTWMTKTIKTNIRKPSHLSGKPFQILTFYVYTVGVVVMVVI